MTPLFTTSLRSGSDHVTDRTPSGELGVGTPISALISRVPSQRDGATIGALCPTDLRVNG